MQTGTKRRMMRVIQAKKRAMIQRLRGMRWKMNSKGLRKRASMKVWSRLEAGKGIDLVEG
jgi:hypothetical protein